MEATDLSGFDLLFSHKEVWSGVGDGGEAAVDGVPSGASFAHVS